MRPHRNMYAHTMGCVDFQFYFATKPKYTLCTKTLWFFQPYLICLVCLVVFNHQMDYFVFSGHRRSSHSPKWVWTSVIHSIDCVSSCEIEKPAEWTGFSFSWTDGDGQLASKWQMFVITATCLVWNFDFYMTRDVTARCNWIAKIVIRYKVETNQHFIPLLGVFRLSSYADDTFPGCDLSGRAWSWYVGCISITIGSSILSLSS